MTVRSAESKCMACAAGVHARCVGLLRADEHGVMWVCPCRDDYDREQEQP